jgi:hypothetical protein
MRARLILLCILLTLALLPAPLWAQADPLVLDQLADPDYAVRQRASAQLLQDDTLTPERCLSLYTQARSEEQRRRITAIAHHHLLRQLRQEAFGAGNQSFIGITHAGVAAAELPQFQQPAVRVLNTIPGFPGHAYLEVGDLILAVDGKPLRMAGAALPNNPNNLMPAGLAENETISSQFVSLVRVHRPGEEVQLRVWRKGELLDVRFALASFVNEGGREIFGPGFRTEYNRDWEAFLTRLRAAGPQAEPLRVPATAAP